MEGKVMEQDTEVTPVVFRRERRKDGEVTAVFPTIPADVEGRQMTCYAHVGQHGGCSLAWYNGTRAAKPEQYRDLAREIEQLGYRLKVYARIQPAHRKAFDAALRRQNNPGAA